jgi:nucleotide-binding universal stress UspA family protein
VPAGRSVPDAIIETARERQADLLVMGAYGHSRLREFIFGGFTRRILDGVDLPVLLFH